VNGSSRHDVLNTKIENYKVFMGNLKKKKKKKFKLS
jgi:hypothetical protein